MSTYHVLQPYFMGLYMALTLLRFFFSLKITRLFGPFIKLISISCSSLLTWALFTLILTLLMDNSLSILLQEDQACDSLSSCGKVLFEAMVGRVLFSKLGNNWPANVALGAFSIILSAVLVNMVIAKINSNYTEVVRKGTLFYYKELLDLRYTYKLDLHYGYLVALEHPFSLVLLPSLCIVKCLESRRRKHLGEERNQFI